MKVFLSSFLDLDESQLFTKKNMVSASTATRVMMQAVLLLASLAAGTCVFIGWYAHYFIPVCSMSHTINIC